jgi:hypothetical protein
MSNQTKQSKEEMRAKQREYYQNHKQTIKAQAKKWQEANKEYYKAYGVEWRSKPENKEYQREYQAGYINEYNKNRKKVDENFNQRQYLRSWIHPAIVQNRITSKMEYIIGATSEEIRNHFEKLFKDNMTWENYGKNGWEIDHIIALKDFDLSKEEEQYKAFNLSNLRPLWKDENQHKAGN